MTNKETAEIIKTARAEVEWEYPMEYAAAFDRAIEVLEQEPKSDWIPVSERLPEEETDVLICNRNGDMELSRGSYSTEVDDFIWYTSGWRFGEVIAWMPLPEPYKEESEE